MASKPHRLHLNTRWMLSHPLTPLLSPVGTPLSENLPYNAVFDRDLHTIVCLRTSPSLTLKYTKRIGLNFVVASNLGGCPLGLGPTRPAARLCNNGGLIYAHMRQRSRTIGNEHIAYSQVDE